MSETHDQIKRLLPLRETLASRYSLEFKKEGTNWVACCPFHAEKTGSFKIKDDADFYKCFGCGDGGDLFTFVEKHDGMDKAESLKILAGWAGVTLSQDSQEQIKGNGRTSSKKAAKREPRKPKSTPKQTKFIASGQFDKYSKKITAKAIKDLETTRGWTRSVIESNDIRHYKDSGSKMRLAIPLYDDEARIANVRLYLPGADKYKLLNWVDHECQKCGAAFINKEGDKVCGACGEAQYKYGEARLVPPPPLWRSDGPVWLVEGEPDWLCALSQNLNAVTQTAGCSTWKEDWSKAFKGRDVIICYDNDKTGREGAEKAAKAIAEYAKSVRIIVWPSFMADKDDLTDWFIKHKRNVGQLQDLLAEAIAVDKPEEPDTLSNSKRFFRGRHGSKFMPSLVAQEILRDNDFVTDPETEIIYRWTGIYWEQYKHAYIRNKALLMLGDEASSSRAADVASMVRDLSILKHGRKMNDQADLICLQNGIFDLLSAKLIPHNKDYFITHALAVEFDPDKPLPKCDRFMTFIEESLADAPTRKEVRKFVGYCMTRETRYEKALLLIGPGGDGKSTLLNVMRALVGEDNCSSVSMSNLEDQFYRSKLVDKLLNVTSEIEDRVFSSDIFKAIVSGDPIGASFKHMTPFDFVPINKMAFAMNKHPAIKDTSDGFYRKLMIVEMKKQFVKKGEADLFLKEKLNEELSGIFAWALAGLQDLRKEGFVASEHITEALMDYKRSNNNVMSFSEQFLIEDNTEEPRSDVYEAYAAFCFQWGLNKKGVAQFGRDLKSIFPNIGEVQRRINSAEVKSGRARYYTGIRFLEYSDKVAGDAPDNESPSPRSPAPFTPTELPTQRSLC